MRDGQKNACPAVTSINKGLQVEKIIIGIYEAIDRTEYELFQILTKEFPQIRKIEIPPDSKLPFEVGETKLIIYCENVTPKKVLDLLLGKKQAIISSLKKPEEKKKMAEETANKGMGTTLEDLYTAIQKVDVLDAALDSAKSKAESIEAFAKREIETAKASFAKELQAIKDQAMAEVAGTKAEFQGQITTIKAQIAALEKSIGSIPGNEQNSLIAQIKKIQTHLSAYKA